MSRSVAANHCLMDSGNSADTGAKCRSIISNYTVCKPRFLGQLQSGKPL